MADTLESLEIEIKHKSTGAAKEVENLAKAVKQLTSAMKGVSRTSVNVGHVSAGIKNVGKAAKESTKSTNKFLESIKRIAFYRMLRSILKSITQAFKEGLEKAYLWSQGLSTESHRFSEAMDRLKSKSNEMKGALGSAFIGLIAAIEPVLTALINMVTKAADAIAQFFAAFTGKRYLKATATSAQFADNMKTGAKAAKEWKNQLMGFDEINRLNEPNNGGGGGGDNPLEGFAYEDAEIDSFFLRLAQRVRDLKDSLDFTPLIKAWEKLKGAIVDFASIVTRALGWAWDNVLVPLSHWTIERATPKLVELLASAFGLLNSVLEALAPVATAFWDDFLEPIGRWTGNLIINALERVTRLLEDLSNVISGDKSFSDFWDTWLSGSANIRDVAVALLGVLGVVMLLNTPIGKMAAGVGLIITGFEGFKTALEDWESDGRLTIDTLGELAGAITMVEVGCLLVMGPWGLLVGAIALGAYAIYKNWDKIKAAWDEFMAPLKEAWENLKISWQDFWRAIDRGIEHMIGWIQSLCAWFDNLFQRITDFFGVREHFNEMNSPDYNIYEDQSMWLGGFASGGFPGDSGQLFVAREAGPEMVGTIGGHTAVANNDQIVEGIRAGVFEAVSAAMSNSNNGGSFHLYLDSREISYGLRQLDRAWGA